ncbi:MAG: DMT family transporter, partial [Pseudomonadales bacterium]
LFLGQRIQWRQAAGLGLGFIGVALVIADRQMIETAQLSSLGIAACFIALLAISLGTVLQKQWAQQVPLLTGSLYQYMGAAVVVALLTYSLETQTVNYTFELFAAMTWLIFGLSVLAILLLLYMIREGEVAKVTSYFYLVPPAAVTQTWLFFDESLGPMAIVGCLAAVLGVFLVVGEKRRV